MERVFLGAVAVRAVAPERAPPDPVAKGVDE